LFPADRGTQIGAIRKIGTTRRGIQPVESLKVPF
jgi:hypothetical protein